MVLRIFLLLALMGAASMIARAMPSPTMPSPAIDVLAFRGTSNASADSTRMDVYIAVPYSALTFLYAGDKYVADYSVGLQVSSPEGTARDGSSGERLEVDRFESFSVLETVSEHRDRVAQGENNSSQSDAEQFSILLTPGLHILHFTLHDLSANRSGAPSSFDTTIAIHLRNFAPRYGVAPSATMIPSMSDVLLYRQRTVAANGYTTIVPSIGPDVSELAAQRIGGNGGNIVADDEASEPESGIFTELYNVPPDSTLGVVAEVVEDHTSEADRSSNDNLSDGNRLSIDSSEVVSIRVARAFHSGHVPGLGLTSPAAIPEMPLFIPMAFDGLWSSHYRLSVYLLPSVHDTDITRTWELEKRSLASARRNIVSRIARGVPSSLTDLDEAIAQLRTIATSVEWDSLTSAQTKSPLNGNLARQKHDAIVQFWQEKNSSPTMAGRAGVSTSIPNSPMQVFYDRIEYANAHFGSSLGPGWKTDRGRVYLALGPPDYIDSSGSSTDQSFLNASPTMHPTSRAYQVWEYSALSAHYTFQSDYMMGEYRLRGSFPPEGTFIWNR